MQSTRCSSQFLILWFCNHFVMLSPVKLPEHGVYTLKCCHPFRANLGAFNEFFGYHHAVSAVALGKLEIRFRLENILGLFNAFCGVAVRRLYHYREA